MTRDELNANYIRTEFAMRPADVERVTMHTDEHGDVWAANGDAPAECIAASDLPTADDIHPWELEYIRAENSFAHPSRSRS